MKISLSHASALQGFTSSIAKSLLEVGCIQTDPADAQFHLVQIHGAPHSLKEDLHILERSLEVSGNKKYLIHRPDELLLNRRLKSFFLEHPDVKLIFLGDLVLRDSFWGSRTEHIRIIPHPYLDYSLPVRFEEKFVLGAFTSWGEMRSLTHFMNLASAFPSESKIAFFAGGTLEGKPLTAQDLEGSRIQFAADLFYPHFNLQLYHLHQRKRFGESSGSLHRGISIPVIFEANGMERLEKIEVVKVESSEDLRTIHYKKAATEILNLIDSGPEKIIERNLLSALDNSPTNFACVLKKYFGE
jgi:hypothetical protein